MPREVFDDLLAYKPPEPCAWDDDVVTFEMAIHKEGAAKIAAILRKLEQDDPQLASAIEALADVLSAVSVVP